jgi:protocatechuate 3,4-dioxygenase beta subunit
VKKVLYVLGAAALLGATYALAAPPRAVAQERGQQQQARSVSGQVTDKSDTPLTDAVVYLKNMRTLAIRTIITNDKGEYNFNGLPTNADFEIYAEYKGKRSPVKTLSSFDSRRAATIHLKVDLSEK